MKKHNKPLVIANWKMNLLKEQAIKLANDISMINEINCDLVICPSDTLISLVKNINNFSVGAQNCSSQSEDFGAYTGEISALMLKNIGCQYVIIGHSERRKYHKENIKTINAKIINAHKAGLIAILCVGENLAQKKAGKSYDIVLNQLSSLPDSFSSANTIVAYEPIWAIGSQNAASLTEINLMHNYIRSVLFENHLKLVYGGSVKEKNAKDILSLDQVDGLLIGSASLNFKEFYQIIK